MSLLIKALDKAEKAQTDKAKKTQAKRSPKVLKTDFGKTGQFDAQTLSLAEPNADLSQVPAQTNTELNPLPVFLQDATAEKQSKTEGRVASPQPGTTVAENGRAANVFAAKRIEPTHQNKKLIMLAGVALLALMAMAWYGWHVYQQLNVPAPVIPPRPMQPPTAQLQNIPAQPAQTQTEPVSTPSQMFTEQAPEQPEVVTVPSAPQAKVRKPRATDAFAEENDTSESSTNAASNEKMERPRREAPMVASPSVSVNVSKNKPEVGVNPELMRAYEAYNAGDDAEAQKLYKQVLRQDIRNVDALLGLGAIASRQGRDADAKGWYRKVLEVEPRNPIAQSATLETQQANDDGLSSESRLKVMIEKSPNDAELHAKLGHWYGDQNQWASAQQAYFEAYRLNPNAENAFNLAVSIDQMGKPKLALPYYQKAQEAMNSSSGIDRDALEARIQAIR